MPSEEQEQDDLIDPLIDNVPVYDAPQMTHQRRVAFITDVARKIDEYATIAMRYGFVDESDMADYIRKNKELRRAIKEERAIWYSGENSETRARELARRGTAECISEAASIGLNETITPSVRLDAVRTLARIAGMDGAGRAQETYPGAEGAARFSVNIHLGADKTVTIAPATIEPDPEH